MRRAQSFLVGYREDLGSHPAPGRPYVVTTRDEAYVRFRHLPPNYLTAYDKPETITEATQLGFMLRPQDARATWAGVPGWPTTPAGDMQLRMVPATARHLQAESPPERYPAVIVWFLAPDRPEIHNELLNNALSAVPLNWQRHHRKVFNKLEFSNQVYSVEFMIGNRQEYDQAVGVMEKGDKRLEATRSSLSPPPGRIVPSTGRELCH